jgi:uncharacterized glyoxalase superfamily protein PhnB
LTRQNNSWVLLKAKGKTEKDKGSFGSNFFCPFCVFIPERIMKIKGLVPLLATGNLRQTIEFYERILGFECRGKFPEVNPVWASLWNGDVEIMFSEPNGHAEFEKPFLTGSIYVYVENVDELWERLRNEVEIVYGIENFEYGMREFGIRDCNGYELNLGQNIE